jgi:hypothetical protein
MAKVLIIFLVILIPASPLFAQVNQYYLVPVDLKIGPGDSTVQVNINVKTIEDINEFRVFLFAEGTSNPVLDTLLTGGLSDTNPPAFVYPSLVWYYIHRLVNPYGSPADPMSLMASEGSLGRPADGLYCRLFFKVSGPGTLSFRTAAHSEGYITSMLRDDLSYAEINWPAAGEVGSFHVSNVNEYLLDPVDLRIGCGDSIVQVNININTIDIVQMFDVFIDVMGASNPVLDTMLTGGLGDANPPAFAPPSLVSGFTQRFVNPYGPPTDPLHFFALSFTQPLPLSTGLWCRMFYKVTGPGSLIFRNGIPSVGVITSMTSPDASSLPINWGVNQEVGSYEVVEVQRRDVNADGQVSVSDVVYLISYLFKGGPAPNPIQSADVNCDDWVLSSDVIFLINYLFKGMALPCE